MSWRARMNLPDLGVGVGLRVPHYSEILGSLPKVDFFEAISENFMVRGGKPRYHIEQVLEHYPLILHGVSLGIGSPHEPDNRYLQRLKELVTKVKPAWVSDHFCFCGTGGAHLHDLLPLPFTEASIRRLAERARRIQDYLEVPFALENTSSYLTFTQSQMPEWEFVSEVAERADIGLLFDVNNVYVSSENHGFDPFDYVRSVPHNRIAQIHLAGHTRLEKVLIDTHDGEVIEPVLDLYRQTIELAGAIPTLIEWDDNIPPLASLLEEVAKVRTTRNQALGLEARAKKEPHRSPLTERLDQHVAWRQGGPRESSTEELSV